MSPGPEMIPERRRAVARALLVGFPVGAEFVALERANREADLPLRRRELDDLHRVGLAHRQRDLLVLAGMVRVVELRDVNQSLDALVELDECAKVRHPDDLALDRVADVMAREEVVPDVGGELLQAERQALVLGVDVQHHRLDDVTLLQHFRRVLDPLAPRHVGDVDQAVDLLLDFDERAELGEVADLALDLRADRILVGQVVPRVGLDLLEAERNPPRRAVDAEHHRVDRVADVEQLRRVLDALAPRHLADVDQPFDAGFELDERAVVGQADDLAAHPRADRVALHHVRPRVGDQLLVAERDALGRRVVLQDDDVDLVVDLEQLGRMSDAAPRHVGDVEQAVDAAQVDERAVVGDVLDHALEDLALGEDVERVLLLLGVLLLEEGLAREHDVAALLIDLDDTHPQFLAAQRVEVADGADINLRTGQEGADADVHRQAALDPLDDAADDDLALRVGLLDFVPNLHLLGFFAREDDVAFAVFGALEEHVDDVAGLDRDFAVLVEELVDRNDPFRLVADVDNHFRRGHLENRALDDLTFRDVPEAVIVGIEQPCVLGRVDLVVVFTGPCLQRAFIRAFASFRSLRRRDPARTGSVLVCYVRHALRVLLYPTALSIGDCRQLFKRVPAPRWVFLNSDKQ